MIADACKDMLQLAMSFGLRTAARLSTSMHARPAAQTQSIVHVGAKFRMLPIVWQ